MAQWHCGLPRVGVRCQRKDSDPTLNPHWLQTKEFMSHPFQFLQVIIKHLLKLMKGREILIYHCWQCPPLSFFFSSLPSFFCTHLLFPFLSTDSRKHLLSGIELAAEAYTKKCVFCPQPAQRSPRFSELPFIIMIAPSTVGGLHSRGLLYIIVFNLHNDLERKSFDNPILQTGKKAEW